MKPGVKKIKNKIIKPSDIVLGFGIPTSQDGFIHDKHLAANKDFVINCCSSWPKYSWDFVRHVNRIESAVTSWGITIVHNLTFNEFGQLFQMKGFDVVILFSHWKNDAVEFYDGLVEISKIVQNIPHEFAGILDLCVCHPTKLVDKLLYERPNFLVRFSNKQATPSFWLEFYFTIFKLIKDRNLTYLQALEDVVDIFLDI